MRKTNTNTKTVDTTELDAIITKRAEERKKYASGTEYSHKNFSAEDYYNKVVLTPHLPGQVMKFAITQTKIIKENFNLPTRKE